MTDKQIALPLSADLALHDAIKHWKALERDPLLDIGDTLNEINNRSQLALGAWLVVFEDELSYGAMTELADRWDRKPNTLSQWKRVYLRTKNVEHAKDLPFGKLQELARIPEPEQAAWLPALTGMKRAELRTAITEAKKTDDWTPPKDEIIVLEPEPESPEPSSENIIEVSPPETHKGFERTFKVGRIGTLEIRWQASVKSKSNDTDKE